MNDDNDKNLLLHEQEEIKETEIQDGPMSFDIENEQAQAAHEKDKDIRIGFNVLHGECSSDDHNHLDVARYR